MKLITLVLLGLLGVVSGFASSGTGKGVHCTPSGRHCTTSNTTTTTVSSSTSTTPPPQPQPTAPYYAEFYYPMYPEWWYQAGVYPHYHPTFGYYSTADLTVEDAHIQAMASAHIEVSISSWWGQGHFSDVRLRSLIAETERLGSPLKWAVYHEGEGNSDPSVSQIASDIAYIRDTLASSSAYLRVPDGRFVIFVYSASPNDLNWSSNFASRWKQANDSLGDPAYISLKVVPDNPTTGANYRQMVDQPDTWHQYSAEQNGDEQAPYSYTIAPGNWHADQATPKFDRTLSLWQQNVNNLVNATEPWRLIVSFNEWWEGTQSEDATEYGSAYMDVLRNTINN